MSNTRFELGAEKLKEIDGINDRAWGAIHKLSQVFLCPAFCFPFSFDFTAQGVKVKMFVVLVHSHITLYYSTFRVRL